MNEIKPKFSNLTNKMHLLLNQIINAEKGARELIIEMHNYERIPPAEVLITESLLKELCNALGWQGGTRHQALDKVKRLVQIEQKGKQ